MQRGVTDRTILAPLAMILVAALATLPLAVLLAGRDVERMANEDEGRMVAVMFGRHLDALAKDLEASARARLPPNAPGTGPAQARLEWRRDQPTLVLSLPHPAGGPRLVETAALDPQRLERDFAAPLQLPDFRLERSSAPSNEHRTRAALAWRAARDGAAISWSHGSAGLALVRGLLPAVSGLMVIIAAGGVLLLRRARRLALGVLEAQAQAEHLALHDSLTGLANRALFMQNLDLALARHRRGLTTVGVYMVDLDRFKQVNDTLGHQAGDDLIVETARRLQAACRAGDTVARFGGDEFAIVAAAPCEGGLEALAERLVDALQGQVNVRGGAARLSGSVGLAVLSESPLDATELLRRADLALYDAKHGGRARHSRYDLAPAA